MEAMGEVIGYRQEAMDSMTMKIDELEVERGWKTLSNVEQKAR
jgi:hypothetical protein